MVSASLVPRRLKIEEEPFSIEHALSCAKGGYPSIRHNEIRDLTANLVTEVCSIVSVEPMLQPITGETFRGASANVQEGARLDIAADGFWEGRFERAFVDVRVFNPYAASNQHQQQSAVYRRHENEKKGMYEQRIREVEHGPFMLLVMSVDLETLQLPFTRDWLRCLSGTNPTT